MAGGGARSRRPPRRVRVLDGRSFDVVVDTCALRAPGSSTKAASRSPTPACYVFVSSLSAHTDDVRAGATEDDDVYEPPFPDTEEVTNETYGPLKVASERAFRARFGERALVDPPRLHRRAVRPDRSVHVLGPACGARRRDAGARAGPMTRDAMGRCPRPRGVHAGAAASGGSAARSPW